MLMICETFIVSTKKRIQPVMEFVLLLLLMSSCSFLKFSTAIDTITSSQPIKDSDVIVSGTGIFTLGFFTPANSTYRYVGIWYTNVSVVAVVWVANRDKPLVDSSGIFTVSDNGDLVLLNGQNEILWSSNISKSVVNSSAQLLDTGNLVLQDNTTRAIMWESFQEPSNSLLPKMKISSDDTTGKKLQLTSWKSPSDPSMGSFSAGITHPNVPELFIWNNSKPYWRSGPWNARTFIGIPDMSNMYLGRGYDVEGDQQGTVYVTYDFGNDSTLFYFLLDSGGNLVQIFLDKDEDTWLAQQTECDHYGKCGPFGICNSQNSTICSCLRGFQPKNTSEWNAGNWTSGCIRRRPLQCEMRENGGIADGFRQLTMVKVPDFVERSYTDDEEGCKVQCLNNCSCIAYAFDTSIFCMSWSGSLVDIQQFSYGGTNLYVRVAYSELDRARGKDNKAVIFATSVITVTVFIAICAYLAWICLAKRRVNRARSKKTMLVMNDNTEEAVLELSDDFMLGRNMSEVNRELQVFKFENLEAATNKFGNKIGEGGFGQVYKGKWPYGQEIAVKRLVKSSGQGVEEFMTEVEVISKLQHRNLVRLLGCCVEGDEKMLIYEYLPNGSLDKVLFDPRKREVLDWKKRFNIIEGIGRGLLYLHRDSRLRIIHRDIKASNILLDESLNPKISDFGTARIFKGNEDKANTNRVVGTYGYMSPEYAMEGRFSEKSDVFSFGVLLLEIVSGRRNTSFYTDEQTWSLLGFAWKLWNEDNVVAFVDPTIFDRRFAMEIWRCVHVGLVCVQEFAKDRPTMSTAIAMLNPSETADLPAPKQPAFTQGHIVGGSESSQQARLSMTIIEGR